MKSVQLLEQRPNGTFGKNENYTLDELKELILRQNPNFFHKPYRRRQRILALEVVFETISYMIDLDEVGKHRVKIRNEEGAL